MSVEFQIRHQERRTRKPKISLHSPVRASLGRIVIALMASVLLFAFSAHGDQLRLQTLGGRTINLYKDYHALVVGVGQYDQWPLHPEAVNNAREVSWALRKLGFSVKLLNDPTMTELRSSMDEFTQETGQEKNRGLLFYYSGNSQSSTSLNGKKIGRIIPKDAPLPGQDRKAFENHTLSTDQIVTIANQIKSKHVLFLFDTALSADPFQVEPAVLRMVNSDSALPTRQFITAGIAQDPITEHHVFKNFLLRGLEGEADLINDGVISGSELGIYLSDRIGNATGEQLHPQFGTIAVSGDIRGDFIFQLAREELKMARLSVETEPEADTIKILNIKPPFTQGIELEPGKYRLRITAEGFETVNKSVTLRAGQDRVIRFKLSEMKPEMTNSLGMRFIQIGAGSFVMGSSATERGRSKDEVSHKVSLAKSFFMQNTEVTVKQFQAFASATGYTSDAEKGDGCWISGNGKGWQKRAESSWRKPGDMTVNDNYPAVCVTWNDAKAFARWLSRKDGRTYRLPSEAEWEFAARAGTSTPFSTGRCLSTKEANYAEPGHSYQKCTTVFGEKQGGPTAVGLLAPNPWKLHNIHGNVSEWCLDWYGPYSKRNTTNPLGPGSGSERVIRGGHWKADAAGCRTATRRRFPQNFASDVVGFRLVMVP